MSSIVFEHDQFLGRRDGRRHGHGFVVSQLVPTVPEDGVLEHAHAEAHFVLVTEGEYISSARGTIGPAGAPTLIYNPPGTAHRDRFRSDTGRFVTVAVSLVAQCGLEDVLTMPDYACVAGPEALQLAQQLIWAGDGALALESICVELMTATATGYEQRSERVPSWLLRARDYLWEETSDTRALAEIALDCGVHPVYLARAFRKHYGCSPGAYQRRLRLNRAAAMLTTDSASITEIAHALGYFDQAHFSNVFREAFGLAPGHYRHRNRLTAMRRGSVRTS